MALFSKTEKIRFEHIDYAGIVFYPRYLQMLNGLVEDWFEEALDSPFASMHQTHGIPTVSLEVQFQRPARLGDVITKELWVNELGGSSIKCGFAFRSAEGELRLQGKVTLVYVKLENESGGIKSEAIPAAMREKISLYLTKKHEHGI